jgi:tight adherence protein B
MSPVLILGGLFGISVFVLVFILVSKLGSREQKDQLFSQGREPSLQAQLDRNAGSPVTAFALQTADRVMSRDRKSRTEVLLQVSGLPFRPAEWLIFRFSVAVALATLFLLFFPNLFAVAGFLLGWFGLSVYARLRANARRRRFAEDLADTLQLVAGSLRSGFSLAASLDAASQHAREPMAGEFKRALARTRVGANLEDGLDDVAERMKSQDFSWVTLAIRIQREVGGNLAEILDSTVETIRERFYIKRQVRALSAEGRLSVYILSALPFLVGGWSMLRNTDYARLLWTTSMGVVMLAVGAVLMVLGWFWMRAVVRVEA